MDYHDVQKRVFDLSKQFAAQRRERHLRRTLDKTDFDLLAQTGYPLIAVPVQRGGLWTSVPGSVRNICELLRTLARGDSCVALVSAMHPAVLSFWLTAPPELENDAAWTAQCDEVFDLVKQGNWFGTITSEHGSGGDVAHSHTVALKTGDGLEDYQISGQKEFGSGSGVMSFMITTAVAEGEIQPDWFYLDMRDVPWDGSRGLRLIARWDGHGMAATDSHSMAFERFPAKRLARAGHLLDVANNAGPFIECLFSSVIVGIVDEAIETARQKIKSKRLGSYEQVEWARAETEHWLVAQALEGMYRAVESKDDPSRDVLQGKTAIAELSESVLTRLCRVVGATTFSRSSPFGFWFEDVRALGFLRPPWGLAFQTLIDMRNE